MPQSWKSSAAISLQGLHSLGIRHESVEATKSNYPEIKHMSPSSVRKLKALDIARNQAAAALEASTHVQLQLQTTLLS